MLNVLDMTEFEDELKDDVVCARCVLTDPDPAVWMIRFGHNKSDTQHVLPYCEKHKQWAYESPGMLFCPCTDKLVPVHIISSWLI
jgi:hypothetical protein